MLFRKIKAVAGLTACIVFSSQLLLAQEYTVKSFEYLVDYHYEKTILPDDEYLWIGTDAGLSKLNKATWQLTNVANFDLDSVGSLIKDAQGRICALGSEHRVAVQDGDGWQYHKFPSAVYYYPRMLDAAGNSVWIGYGNEDLLQITSPDTISYPGIKNIVDVEYGTSTGYWAISSDKIFALKNGTWQIDTTGVYWRDLHIDALGNIYVLAENSILKRRKTSNVYDVVPCPLLEQLAPMSIRSDSQGNLYIATWGGVLIRANNEWFKIDASNGLPFSNVEDLEVDEDNNAWVYTTGWKQEQGEWKYYKAITVLINTSDDEGEQLHGLVYFDQNNNGQREDSEPGIPNQMIKLEPGNTFAITNAEGTFSFHPSEGSNTITTLLKGFWEQGATPISYTFTYPQSSPSFEIGLKWKTVNDVAVSASSTAARPGFDVQYYLTVRNEGSVTASTNLALNYNSALTYLNSDTPPTTVTAGRLEWNVNNLSTLQNKNIRVSFTLSANTPLGTVLTAPVTVTSVSGETDLDDNADTLKVTVTGSFDPNDKLVKEGILDERFVELGSFLNYTIRFQNTGTDTAFTVKIKDELDPHLDRSTLEVLASSHPMTYSLDGSLLTFVFPNIKLPDSTRNEPGSHGYARFRIKNLSATLNNTVVKNSALIYFDFNAPVETNEVSVKYVNELPDVGNVLGSERALTEQSLVFPNPVKGFLRVSEKISPYYQTGELRSLDGRKIRTFTITAGGAIDLNDVPPGIYLLRLSGSKGLKTIKIIVAG